MRGDGFKEIEPKGSKPKSSKPGKERAKAPEKTPPAKDAPGILKTFKKIFDPQSMSGLTLTLFLITAVVAVLLGFVNSVTAPEIRRRAEETAKEAMTVVLNADEYVRVGESKLYRAQDAGGRLLGFVVQVEPSGYGGKISMMVGVDLQLNVTDVSIMSMSETAGLGTKANDRKFLDQFVGKSVSMKLGEDIDALSGATITSKAVLSGVQDALTQVLQYLADQGGTAG